LLFESKIFVCRQNKANIQLGFLTHVELTKTFLKYKHVRFVFNIDINKKLGFKTLKKIKLKEKKTCIKIKATSDGG
jgi:hypothetical protein